MAKRRSAGWWVLPFAIGLIVGLLIDLGLRIGGSVSWIVLAIPFGAAGITVAGTLVAESFRQSLQDDADRRRRMDLHAESLAENSLVWLQNIGFVSNRFEFNQRSVSGLCIESAQGNVALSSLKLWRYAERHLAQDPTLGPRWIALKEEAKNREQARSTLVSEFRRTIEGALTSQFGPGWVPALGMETPQPPRWYNGELIWNWLIGRRVAGDFKDEQTTFHYGLTDVPAEIRYIVSSTSYTVISTNDDGGSRAAKTSAIVGALRENQPLSSLVKALEEYDRKLSDHTAELREPLAEFYERSVESKQIVGECPVCP